MVRNIKFRGMDDKKEWKHGSFIESYEGEEVIMYVIQEEGSYSYIDRVTLGQYTGLKDASGKDIYEGDILKMHSYVDWDYHYKQMDYVGVVEFDEGGFSVVTYVGEDRYVSPFHMTIEYGGMKHYEIVGNIYESAGLLKDEE